MHPAKRSHQRPGANKCMAIPRTEVRLPPSSTSWVIRWTWPMSKRRAYASISLSSSTRNAWNRSTRPGRSSLPAVQFAWRTAEAFEGACRVSGWAEQSLQRGAQDAEGLDPTGTSRSVGALILFSNRFENVRDAKEAVVKRLVSATQADIEMNQMISRCRRFM